MIKKKIPTLSSKVLDKINFLKGRKIGIAISGGIDSMVLLDLMSKLSKDLKIHLHVLHFNHKWREESHLDLKLVENFCKVKNIDFIQGENKTKNINNEEVAREQRYSFFEEIAKRHNLDFVCTAHHKDDFIETIIFRLLRGTGPKGLMPIKDFFQYSKDLTVFRPLLNLNKKEIVDYAKVNKISFNEDKTNKDISHKRNFIRKKILPLLEEVNSNYDQNLLNLSDLVFSQDKTLDHIYNNSTDLINSIGKHHIKVNKKQFSKMSEYEQKSFIYWLMSKIKIKGNISKIQGVLDDISTSKKISLSKDIFLISTKEHIYFGPEKEETTKLNKNSKLTFKEIKLSKFNGKYPKDNSMTAFANLSSYKRKSLKVRFRSPKDIFQPLGFKKTTKLKNYLLNKKISKEERYNLPLLCFRNEVLWIPGYSISEKIKVIKSPTHFLKFSTSE
jgi:tRNA(Ile)-lysidine synthase